MTKEKLIIQLTAEAIEKLDEALAEAVSLRHRHNEQNIHIGELGRAIGLVREFQKPLLAKHPELKPPPPWADEPKPTLTAAEKDAISQLSTSDIQCIDDALLTYASHHYQKVAKIVATFISESDFHQAGIPDLFYAMRIESLANQQRLEYQGNLKYMRYCEVRLTK